MNCGGGGIPLWTVYAVLLILVILAFCFDLIWAITSYQKWRGKK